MQRIAENASLKKRTRQYWRETLDALLKHWPALAETEVRRLTATACREWSGRYAKIASPSRYHNTLSLLRPIIDVAIPKRYRAFQPCGWLGAKDHPPKATRATEPLAVRGFRLRNAGGQGTRFAQLRRVCSRLGFHRLPDFRSGSNRMARLGFRDRRNPRERRPRGSHKKRRGSPGADDSRRA